MRNVLSGLMLILTLINSNIFAESFDKIISLKKLENSGMDSWIDLETELHKEKMDLIKKQKTEDLNLALKYMDQFKKLSSVSDLGKISDDKLSEMLVLHDKHSKEWKDWYTLANKKTLDLATKMDKEYSAEFPNRR